MNSHNKFYEDISIVSSEAMLRFLDIVGIEGVIEKFIGDGKTCVKM